MLQPRFCFCAIDTLSVACVYRVRLRQTFLNTFKIWVTGRGSVPCAEE